MADVLDSEVIGRGLQTGWMGHRLEVRKETESTNDDCIVLARAGAPAGTVVTTEWQRAGRGRRGRHWTAPPGSAVLLSTVLRPALPVSAIGRIGMAAALAVVDALARTCGVSAAVKYPNDVLLDGRKVAGVLPEVSVSHGHLDWAVLGIGINVRQSAVPPGLEAHATSIEAHTQPPERNAIIRALLASLERHLEQAESDPALLAASWRACDTVLGQQVSLTVGEDRLIGVASDVDEDANLLLRLPGGSERWLAPSEVTFRT